MFKQTVNTQTIRFKNTPQKNHFTRTLQKRITQYFKENNITPYANSAMWFKAFFAIIMWTGVYSFIISDYMSVYPSIIYWTSLILAFTLLGFVNIFIAFNISHDALHGSYSPKKWVNDLLGYSFNFIGGNAYLFKKIHTSHHLFANIQGIDPQMESHGLLRNTPHEPFMPKHKNQHLYVLLMYAGAMLHWTVVKDFKWMFAEQHIGNEKNIKHPWYEIVILFVSKAVFFSYALILPLLVLNAPWWIIIIGFLSIHILPGLTFALIFQSNHVFDGSTYPIPDKDGNIENNYVLHTLETTLDFARKNPLACWLMGGINVHVIHHMFPAYCHVHSPVLTEKVLIPTCKEFGIKYMEVPGFIEAVKKHLHMLKQLTHPNASAPKYDKTNVQALQTIVV